MKYLIIGFGIGIFWAISLFLAAILGYHTRKKEEEGE